MVKQYVSRGDIVWNFPGGGIEEDEDTEQACMREVKEETGYNIRIIKLLIEVNSKYTYLAEVVDGELFVDHALKENDDIIEAAWISLDDKEKFDHVITPLLEIVS